MFVSVQITLQEGDEQPVQTPLDILAALGGDPSKDTISVSVSANHTPPPPVLETLPAPPPVQ